MDTDKRGWKIFIAEAFREKRCGTKFLVGLCFMLIVWLAADFPAYAENASVTYGSSEYTPIENEEFNIGLYIQCDAPDFIYTVTIQYDPARMEYLGGADVGGNGTLQFAGNGSGGEQRYMLTFRALSEGDGSISVTEASVITVSSTETAGEGEMGAGMDAQEVQGDAAVPKEAVLTALGSAAVRVQPSVDCSLSGLSIEEVPSFELEPGVYEYELEVPADTEELRLEAAAQDERASVDISGTALDVGENVITITVSSTAETVQYFLHVTRPEAEPHSEIMEETETASALLWETEEEEQEAVPAFSGTVNNPEGQAPERETHTEGKLDEIGQSRTGGTEAEGAWIPTIQYLILIGGLTLVAATGGLVFSLWKRKRREEEYFDEDDEEWIDLTEDERWLRWLEEVEEAEEEMGGMENCGKTVESEKIRVIQQPETAKPKPESKKSAETKPISMKTTEGVTTPVIRIENVSMRFRISEVNAGSLKEYLLATVKRQNRYHELEALQHISFEIGKGEVVGIIGTNGSGKSTLLKLIAGVLKPSEGKIEVDRKKVQLLTLGTGFDSELTARENVYLNGAIIGYSREYIDENFDKIVEFAELEGFMDEKIKNFSSGMTSRLGFAIATVGETAEILILDEVLSVGDMFFRQKSEKRIKEMIHSGSTVLIVSHSTDTIIKNCTKAVWIEKGVLREIGEPEKVCEAYRKMAG